MINYVNLLKYNQIRSANSGSTTKKASAPSSDFSALLSNSINSAVNNQTTGSSSLDDIFERASKQYNVPVNLLKAVGKAESNFNSKAVSSCGAQGIMQLMPGTAKSLGVQDSFNAEQNVMGGAKYLRQLLTKYNGNTTLAVAAYNAGSGNVDKYGGVPPFSETQAYVKRVLGYAGENINVPEADPSYAGQLTSLTPLSSMYTALNNSNDPSSNLSAGLLSSLGSSNTTSNSSYLNLIQLLLAQMQANSSSYTNFTNSSGSSANSNSTYLGLIQAMLSQMQANSSGYSNSSNLSNISAISPTSELEGLDSSADNSSLNIAQSMLSQMGASTSGSLGSSSNSGSVPYGLL
jgi:flagellar hook-basal body complex protein FliE